MTQTLEELKAANAKEEEATLESTAGDEEETNLEAAEEEEQETEIPAEEGQEEGSETEVESWMQTEEQASDDAKFTSSDIAAAKRKLKAKLGKKDSEIDDLKKEIEALKENRAQPVQSGSKPRPKREDFDYDEDAYDRALDQWYEDRFDNKLAQSAQQSNEAQSRQQDLQRREKALDSHYEEAASLVKDSQLDEQVYHDSEMEVRRAIDSVLPGQGDTITDALIQKINKGSSKVMFYLGRNPSKRAELVESLRNDPTGIEAAILLGTLKSEIAVPKKRMSKAPAPSKKANGEGGSSSERGLKAKYDKAISNNDIQARIDIRREAKASGIDVSNW